MHGTAPELLRPARVCGPTDRDTHDGRAKAWTARSRSGHNSEPKQHTGRLSALPRMSMRHRLSVLPRRKGCRCSAFQSAAFSSRPAILAVCSASLTRVCRVVKVPGRTLRARGKSATAPAALLMRDASCKHVRRDNHVRQTRAA